MLTPERSRANTTEWLQLAVARVSHFRRNSRLATLRNYPRFQSLPKSVEPRCKRRRTVSPPRCQFSAWFKSGLFRVSQHNRKPGEPVDPPVVSNGERDLVCPRLRKRLGYFCQQARIALRQVVRRTKHIHRRSKP